MTTAERIRTHTAQLTEDPAQVARMQAARVAYSLTPEALAVRLRMIAERVGTFRPDERAAFLHEAARRLDATCTPHR